MKVSKIIITLTLLLLASAPSAMALSYYEEEAKKIAEDYYKRLQAYCENPNNAERQKRVIDLFDNEDGSDGNVYNDLLEVEGNHQNQEDGIGYYLSTIQGLWNRRSMKLSIKYEIDKDSYHEELDPDIRDEKKYVVWVTVMKTVNAGGRIVYDKKREVFKIKEGRIQTICTPERSTSDISGLKYYNDHQYKLAYEAFMKKITNETANGDTYFYLGLLLRKGKDIGIPYPQTVKDKLCAFYWMKCQRGRRALNHYRMYTYYLDLGNYPSLFNHGLMPVYKGEGVSYGFMDERGKMIIPYKYKFASRFYDEGIAIVQFSDGKWGFIDTQGNPVGKRYSKIKGLSNGYSAVNDNGKWGYIDYHGKELIAPTYKDVSHIAYNRFAYQDDNGAWGCKDLDGNLILKPTFDIFKGFTEPGVSIVGVKLSSDTFAYGLVNTDGQIVLPINYKDIQINKKNGYVVVEDMQGNIGRISFKDIIQHTINP